MNHLKSFNYSIDLFDIEKNIYDQYLPILNKRLAIEDISKLILEYYCEFMYPMIVDLLGNDWKSISRSHHCFTPQFVNIYKNNIADITNILIFASHKCDINKFSRLIEDNNDMEIKWFELSREATLTEEFVKKFIKNLRIEALISNTKIVNIIDKIYDIAESKDDEKKEYEIEELNGITNDGNTNDEIYEQQLYNDGRRNIIKPCLLGAIPLTKGFVDKYFYEINWEAILRSQQVPTDILRRVLNAFPDVRNFYSLSLRQYFTDDILSDHIDEIPKDCWFRIMLISKKITFDFVHKNIHKIGWKAVSYFHALPFDFVMKHKKHLCMNRVLARSKFTSRELNYLINETNVKIILRHQKLSFNFIKKRIDFAEHNELILYYQKLTIDQISELIDSNINKLKYKINVNADVDRKFIDKYHNILEHVYFNKIDLKTLKKVYNKITFCRDYISVNSKNIDKIIFLYNH